MTVATTETPQEEIVYPESDGKPMADNTKQARWIVVLHGNLEALFRDAVAFVALNLRWYARKGFPEECAAPDVFVAFGRPKTERRSYKQWEEGDVVPQVVFEVLSPNFSVPEMDYKEAFYPDHGVQEYYVYDPNKDYLSVLLRKGTVLRRKWFQNEFTSPLLGIRFDLTGPEMRVFYPDGRQFLTFPELEADCAKQVQLRVAVELNLQTTELKLQTAEKRFRRLAELIGKFRRGQASLEEVAELERLENEPFTDPAQQPEGERS